MQNTKCNKNVSKKKMLGDYSTHKTHSLEYKDTRHSERERKSKGVKSSYSSIKLDIVLYKIR